MAIGKITSLVTALHLGVLKKYGYKTNMLDGSNTLNPSSIEVTDPNLLEEKLIVKALENGLIVFESYSEESYKESNEVVIDPSLLTDAGKDLLKQVTLLDLEPTDEDGKPLTEDTINTLVEKLNTDNTEEKKEKSKKSGRGKSKKS